MATLKPQLKFSVIEYRKSNGKHNDKKIHKNKQLLSLVVGSRFDSCNGIIWIWNHGIMELVIQNGIHIFKTLPMDIISLLRNYRDPLLRWCRKHKFTWKRIQCIIKNLIMETSIKSK
eukprot:134672_1